MQCISPIRVNGTYVPCGSCNFCLSRKRQDWSFRLKQELKSSKTASFLTLTYEEEQVPRSPSGLITLLRDDYQAFMKAMRDFQRRKAPKRSKWPPLRYYACGEYGTNTERPHYHSIMFNMMPETKNSLPGIWNKGHIHVGSVTGESIGYVTKYVINRPGEYEGREPPFSSISNRSGGLGKSYLVNNTRWHKDGKRFYVINENQPGSLPRYYKEKIFNQHEKEYHRYQLMQEIPENYWKEVEALSEFHDDPESYLQERIKAAYEAVKNKSNENSKF